MDSLTLTSLILSMVSTIIIFIKGIKKCKCGNLLVIERESELEVQMDRSIQKMLERNINNINNQNTSKKNVRVFLNKNIKKEQETKQKHTVIDIKEDDSQKPSSSNDTKKHQIENIDDAKSDDVRNSVSISSDSTAPKVFTKFVLKK